MKKYLFILGTLIGISFICAVSAGAQSAVPVSSSEQTIAAGSSLTMTVPSTDTLRIVARISYSKPAGANFAMELSVNDKPVTSSLLNKGSNFTYEDGRTFPYQSGSAWMLFYSQDFSANNSSAGGGYQVMTDPGQAYLYKWDIASLVGGAKTMKLVIKNNGKSAGMPIIVKVISTYPIAELGGCTDETACKAYCSKQEHYAACADYGQKNNIISPEDAAKAKEFADVLKGQGPGGCKDETSCRSYCEGTAHLSECIAFAEKHNFVSGDQLAEAKKVINALANGGTLPGGCTDKASCETYCKAGAHVEECFAFAKKAGFISEQDAAEAEKVIPFIKSGETPGGCTNKADCQNYCDDTSHAVECINFAEKAGFATKEEADIVRKTGGVGPGGCKSKESCDAYCNKKENQQSCFDFAKKYDIIPADKLKEMQDGMGRLRGGLDQMPPEAIACLKENLGEDIVTQIQNGTFAPGPQTGETIKGCFEKIMPQLQAKLQQGLGQATPQTMQCLESGLGAGELEKLKNGEAPTPEHGDVLRKCFESMKTEGMKRLKDGLDKMPPEIKTCLEGKLGADTVQKIQSGETVNIGPEVGAIVQDCVKAGQGALEQKMQEGLKNAPPEMQDCIKSKLGNISEKMQSGELNGEADVQKLIQECISQFKPQGMPGGANIPGGIPKDLESLKKLQEQYGGQKPPEGVEIPEGGKVPSSGGVPPAGAIPQVDCAQFSAVPSCSYVPEGPAQEMCKKCKSE